MSQNPKILVTFKQCTYAEMRVTSTFEAVVTTGVDMANFITPKECFESDSEDEWDEPNDGNERNDGEPRNIFELLEDDEL